MKKINLILVLVFSLALALSANAASIPGWADPPSNPPANNAKAPINVSSVSQMKTGPLVLGNTLQVNGNSILSKYIYIKDWTNGTASATLIGRDRTLQVRDGGLAVGGWPFDTTPAFAQADGNLVVKNKIGASEYCDLTGRVCKTIDQIGGGSTGGVTQIKAGANITISPAAGTGIVTINAAGGTGGGTTPNTIPNLQEVTNKGRETTQAIFARDFCLPDGRCLSEAFADNGGGTGGGGNPPAGNRTTSVVSNSRVVKGDADFTSVSATANCKSTERVQSGTGQLCTNNSEMTENRASGNGWVVTCSGSKGIREWCDGQYRGLLPPSTLFTACENIPDCAACATITAKVQAVCQPL